MGAFFINRKEADVIRTTVGEMGCPHRKPTPTVTNNYTAIIIANYTSKQRRPKATHMQFYWCQNRVSKKRFCVYWNSIKVNLGDYYSEHHAEKNHQIVRPIYLNKNNSPRNIPINIAMGLQGCVYLDQGNAQSINPNRLVR